MNDISDKKKWVIVIGAGVIGLAWWGLLVVLVIAAIRWLAAHS